MTTLWRTSARQKQRRARISTPPLLATCESRSAAPTRAAGALRGPAPRHLAPPAKKQQQQQQQQHSSSGPAGERAQNTRARWQATAVTTFRADGPRTRGSGSGPESGCVWLAAATERPAADAPRAAPLCCSRGPGGIFSAARAVRASLPQRAGDRLRARWRAASASYNASSPPTSQPTTRLAVVLAARLGPARCGTSRRVGDAQKHSSEGSLCSNNGEQSGHHRRRGAWARRRARARAWAAAVPKTETAVQKRVARWRTKMNNNQYQ